MRTAWRLVKESHVKDAFSGEGARLYGGRWNHRGVPAVYLSEHLSLAVLEQFVHLTQAQKNIRFSSIRVEIPEDLPGEEIRPENLPEDWRTEPGPMSSKNLGTRWVEAARTAVLRVPSVIIPEEFNLMLNPRHTDFSKLRMGTAELFSLDPRLWK